VIVVVGSPCFGPSSGDGPPVALGAGAVIAAAARAAGASVQLVGKVGDDPAGDAVLVALGRAGVAHAAIMRDPTRATPAVTLRDETEDEFSQLDTTPGSLAAPSSLLLLDPVDLALALGYLNGFAVLLVADPLGPASILVAAEAAAYAGAALVVLVAAGTDMIGLPVEATVIAVPDEDPDGVFAQTVGAFAAALDAGDAPGVAFRMATSAVGWQPAPG
jgi:sugar/nucleoside kinase (ribokinase family)